MPKVNANFPTCPKCMEVVWAGEIVKPQGVHVLCDDPGMDRHQRLMRPYIDTIDGKQIHTLQFGYVDDAGNVVWL